MGEQLKLNSENNFFFEFYSFCSPTFIFTKKKNSYWKEVARFSWQNRSLFTHFLVHSIFYRFLKFFTDVLFRLPLTQEFVFNFLDDIPIFFLQFLRQCPTFLVPKTSYTALKKWKCQEEMPWWNFEEVGNRERSLTSSPASCLPTESEEICRCGRAVRHPLPMVTAHQSVALAGWTSSEAQKIWIGLDEQRILLCIHAGGCGSQCHLWEYAGEKENIMWKKNKIFPCFFLCFFFSFFLGGVN